MPFGKSIDDCIFVWQFYFLTWSKERVTRFLNNRSILLDIVIGKRSAILYFAAPEKHKSNKCSTIVTIAE